MRKSDPGTSTKASVARRFVVLMAVAAAFGDMTYEGARGLVGPFLASLGASATAVGFVAGLGEFLGYGLRLVTGAWADRTRRYWAFVLGGYAANAVVVLGLWAAARWEVALAFVLLERVGKAVRSPSRSALVAAAASEVGHGKAFGFDEALDQLGAVSGPLLTALVLFLAPPALPLVARYQLAFLVLVLPVLGNVAVVLRARRLLPSPDVLERPRAATDWASGAALRWYVAASLLVALGFADWALVAFHASKAGLLGPTALPVLYAGMMGVDALAALGFGRAFDVHGLKVLGVACVVSAGFAPAVFLAPSAAVLVVGGALWAVGLGAQEAVFKAAIASLVPPQARARAYGVFFAAFGAAWWVGSTCLGWLYEHGVEGAVAFSVVTQLAAAIIFFGLGRARAATG